MRDEDAQRLLTEKGVEAESWKRRYHRRGKAARRVITRQRLELQRLRAALMDKMREDE